jgi:5-methylthioadenosine/S-adenosylhomocysteine deaminase
MERQSKLSRRAVLGAALVAGLGRDALSPAAAQTPAAPASTGGGLPARGNFVIRDAYVMTMDPTLGDIPNGDVHADNGVIVALGRKLDAPAATSIDGRATIVIPGFVETHWHMWNSLLRSMAGDKPELGYFPTVAALGKAFLPKDMYQGTRLAA